MSGISVVGGFVVTFRERLAAVGPRNARPKHAEGLLLEPICEDPRGQLASDARWASEHCLEKRFFVGGIEWFSDVTGMSTLHLSSFRSQATALSRRLDWPSMNGARGGVVQRARGQWGKIAPQQFFNVAKSRPVQFPKAALYILACELALQSLVENPYSANDEGDAHVVPSHIRSGEEVYNHMAIIGACWNINDFNSRYLSRVREKYPNFISELADQFDIQQPTELFSELAAGHTVTFDTAITIKQYSEVRGEPLGNVRFKSGQKLLGTKQAAPSEIISLV